MQDPRKEAGDSPGPAAGPRGNPFAALRAKLGSLPPGPARPEAPTGAPTDAATDAARPAAGPRPVSERVTVRRERAGRGGKTVTLAEGPAFAGRKLEPLAREAARALGVGARVEGGALVLQGDQAERLAAWLATKGFARVERGN